jgi:hypothetical protein
LQVFFKNKYDGAVYTKFLLGSMVAAFGSGALFSLVSGMGTPNPAVNAVTTGLFFSLFQGGIYMVGFCFSDFIMFVLRGEV